MLHSAILALALLPFVIRDLCRRSMPGFDASGSPDRVYNFRHRGPSWSREATYVPAEVPTAKIGASVSIDRETTVVGARDYDNRGAAFVFETGKKFDGAKYVRLQPSGLSLDADFGASVAVSGNTIVVGSPNAFDGAGAAAG